MKRITPTILLVISVIALCLIVYYLNTRKREHFSVVFYGDKPKEVTIPATYPKYQQGPCLRKNKKGLVSWGNLTGENPGECVYHSEQKTSDQTNQTDKTSQYSQHLQNQKKRGILFLMHREI